MTVKFSNISADLESDLAAIKAQFTAIGKYQQNSRCECMYIDVKCSSDLDAQEQSDIVAWGEAQGYTVEVTP